MCVTPNWIIQTQKNQRVRFVFFFAEINDREKMSKTPNKYITALKYTDNNWLVLPGASISVSLC